MATNDNMNNPWYLDPKYQDYWTSFNRLNVSERSHRYSNPDDIRAIAYWRSLALSLQYENNQLHSLLSHMFGAGIQPPAPSSDEFKGKEKKVKSKKIKHNQIHPQKEEFQSVLRSEDVEEEYCEEEEGEDLEDYLKFVEETERHRRERDRLRKEGDVGASGEEEQEDQQTDNVLRQAEQIAVDHERLKREMEELYGCESLRVHCVETRLQLAVNEWSDLHRPVTWPALSLNSRR